MERGLLAPLSLNEQTALRRVATLVARGVPPVEIFSAVSHEVARLFGAQAAVLRFEADGSAVVFVGVSKTLELQVGTVQRAEVVRPLVVLEDLVAVELVHVFEASEGLS